MPHGRLKDGKRQGKWTFYYKSGGLKATGKYLAGDLDGPWEWWRENGQPLQARLILASRLALGSARLLST
jgi:antitoxin component YwqK of YwqJK toxin-antitoxin module